MASLSSLACCVGVGTITPDSALGSSFSLPSFAGGGVAGGVGGVAALGLLSNDPTCNLPLYFLRIDSL